MTRRTDRDWETRTHQYYGTSKLLGDRVAYNTGHTLVCLFTPLASSC